ncbi:MAG: hypothetical protein WCO66_03610 [Candidatus Absconditabacteria bacterium]
MKKHKNLIIFLTITLLRSIFLGMVKIFLRSALKEDHRTLEEIAGYLSVGFGLAYLVGGGLTYAFRKKYITIASGVSIIICLIWGFLTDYFPFKNFALLLMGMGFFTGLWLTVKGIIITIEIMNSKRSETVINAIVNVTLLIGLLIGSYRGFGAYDWLKEVGFVAIVGLLIIATILTFFLSYDKEFKAHSLHSAIIKDIPNILQAIKKYFRLLIPIGAGWAVSTGIMQKVMEIGLDHNGKATHDGVIIIVCTMVGTIIGNILGTKMLKQRQKTSNVLTILLTISIIVFPLILRLPHKFFRLNTYNIYLGVIFGIIINIREARFYHMIGDDNRKEFGSAAYGIINSALIFGVMITTNFITNHLGTRSSFVFFGLCIAACFPLIRRLK